MLAPHLGARVNVQVWWRYWHKRWLKKHTTMTYGATRIQAWWRGRQQRVEFARLQWALELLQKNAHGSPAPSPVLPTCWGGWVRNLWVPSVRVGPRLHKHMPTPHRPHTPPVVALLRPCCAHQ